MTNDGSEREKLAAWMIAHSFATGHGDTLDDLLGELSAQVRKMQSDRAPSAASHRLLADAVVSRDERVASLQAELEGERWRANVLRDEQIGLIAAVQRMTAALGSIAGNTCCGPCQEAALVARAALRPHPLGDH